MFKINDWISRDSKVLDLGCGDGSLLNDLRKEKSTSGLGIEIAVSYTHLTLPTKRNV